MNKLLIVVMALLGMASADNGVALPKSIFQQQPRVGFVEVPIGNFPIQQLVIEALARFNNQVMSSLFYTVKSIFKAEKLQLENSYPQYRIEVQFAQTDCYKSCEILRHCNVIDVGNQPKARINVQGNMENRLSMTITPLY